MHKSLVLWLQNALLILSQCVILLLKGVDVSFDWKQSDEQYRLLIEVKVKTEGSTGVEMEALTAASATALTVYDMCKAVDKGMIIGETYLLEKQVEKVEIMRESLNLLLVEPKGLPFRFNLYLVYKRFATFISFVP